MSRKDLFISLIFFFCIITGFAQETPAPKVRYAGFNVNTGEMEVRWEPINHPDVNTYRVWYHYPDRGNITGDWLGVEGEVNASDELVLKFDASDLSEVTPLSGPVVFGVQAYDASSPNPKSLNALNEEEFDSTIFLQASYDSCLATATLEWNEYNFKQWPQPGCANYSVFISDDGGETYSLQTTLPSGTKNHKIERLEENRDYVIYIAANSNNVPADAANSNLFSINTNMAVLPDYMYANYATYKSNSVEVSFTIDPQSQTKNYNLLRSTDSADGFEIIHSFNTSSKELTYTDNVNYYSGPFYYKVEVINYCDVNIAESNNISSTILLQNIGSSLVPELIWNGYVNWLNGVDYYKIERKFGDSEFTEVALTTSTSYTDNELQGLVEYNYSAHVCYQLTAFEQNGNNSSSANPVCFDLPVNIRFEFDAFTPGSGGGNDTFRPIVDFIPDEYHFEVIDRSGRKVYESKDPENTSWDGYYKGKLVAAGAYMCIVQYRIGNGKRKTIRGAVVVVY